MKMYTKLFIAGIIFLFLPIRITTLFSLFCFAGGFILLICKGITEITNKDKAPKQNYTYTYEAQKACEKVTPKQKQDTTPPWEQ